VGEGTGLRSFTAPQRLRRRWRRILGPLRLRIAIPALLALIPLLYGLSLFAYLDIQHDRLLAEIRAGGGIVTKSSVKLARELELDRLTVLAFAVPACLLGGAIGLGFVLYLVRPMDRLRASFQLLAQGDFTQRLDLGQTRDEIGQMGQTFDQAIRALHDLFTKRNRLLYDPTPHAIITVDLDGIVHAANLGALSLLVGDEDKPLVGENLIELLEENAGNEPIVRALADALSSGQRLAPRPFWLHNLSDQATRVMLAGLVLEQEPGQMPMMALTLQDMADLQDFHERIARADRLAAIGTLATGLAHEIRNPLGSIKGLTQLMIQSAQDQDSGSDTQKYGAVILHEVNRLDRLLSEMLEYSHPQGAALEIVNLFSLLEGAAYTARMKWSGQLGQDLPEARLSVPQDLELSLPRDKAYQGFLNVIQNAFEAAYPAGGSEVRVFIKGQRHSDGGARIEISNTGSTIAAEDLGRIFQPFFTTKESGTGLGLAICYQIFSYLGAHLDASSEEDRVTFTIDLPPLVPTSRPVSGPVRVTDSSTP